MNEEDFLRETKDRLSNSPLLPGTKAGIEEIAHKLACINESYDTIVVSVLRKALEAKLNERFGTSVPEWTKVINGLDEIRESGQWPAFEEAHIRAEIDRQLRDVDERLIAYLLARLSPSVRRLYESIDSGLHKYPRDRGLVNFDDELITDIPMVVSLNEAKFYNYETRILVPNLKMHRQTLLQRRGHVSPVRARTPKRRLNVGPVKYSEKLFVEVERLIQNKGLKKRDALEKVFSRHFDDDADYSLEGFKKQFRVRYESTIRFKKDLFEKVDRLRRAEKTALEATKIVFDEAHKDGRSPGTLKDFRRAYREYRRRKEE